jgi:hypothetical protein
LRRSADASGSQLERVVAASLNAAKLGSVLA